MLIWQLKSGKLRFININVCDADAPGKVLIGIHYDVVNVNHHTGIRKESNKIYQTYYKTHQGQNKGH